MLYEVDPLGMGTWMDKNGNCYQVIDHEQTMNPVWNGVGKKEKTKPEKEKPETEPEKEKKKPEIMT